MQFVNEIAGNFATTERHEDDLPCCSSILNEINFGKLGHVLDYDKVSL